MTIKDIEVESGMSRANIRFYEAEGLLNPERRANGYREYSEEDLEILKRIKLLRTLHISLEEIKSLHSGERALVDTLDQHLRKLQKEKTDIEQAQEVCKVMRNDGVQYRTLNAQHYLNALERSTGQSDPDPLFMDIVPELRIPWRRFFARILDYALYSTILDAFLTLVMNANLGTLSNIGNILNNFAVLIIMFIVEPVLLTLFGTTLGKWILGIRVTDNSGRRMTYSKALERTRIMLLDGMGLGIPVYKLIRLWKSYRAHSDGDTLDWEWDSEIILKDEKSWRTFVYLGTCAALFGTLLLAIATAELPRNRGDITVAEFCENYNRFANYYSFNTDSYLNAQGNWAQYEGSGNTIYFGGLEEPTFIFEETDGFMTGLQFSVNIEDGDENIATNQDEMILSILSFVGAQKENSPFLNERVKKLVNGIYASPYESYQFSVYGVNVTCDIECYGYIEAMGVLFPMEGVESKYYISFSMRKEGGE